MGTDRTGACEKNTFPWRWCVGRFLLLDCWAKALIREYLNVFADLGSTTEK